MPTTSGLVRVPMAAAQELVVADHSVAVLRAHEQPGQPPVMERFARAYVLARMHARGAFLAGEVARSYNFGLLAIDAQGGLMFVQTAADPAEPPCPSTPSPLPSPSS